MLKADDAVRVERIVDRSISNLLMKERRRDRLWRNIRFLIVIMPVIVMLGFQWYLVKTGGATDFWPFGPSSDYAAVVRIDGTIASGNNNSAEKLGAAVEKAFEKKNSKGVILYINSPGGSAAQSMLLHDRILALKRKHPDVKVIAVAEDYLASGAYMVAVAADSIVVTDATIVGSIGTVMRGFGLADLIDKVGVERRVFASGPRKNLLDPFSPMTDEDRRKVEAVVNEVNAGFVSRVEADRGDKLKSENGPEDGLFTGDFWTGRRAVELGLADRIASLDMVLDEIGAEDTVDLTPDPLLRSLRGLVGSVMADAVAMANPTL